MSSIGPEVLSLQTQLDQLRTLFEDVPAAICVLQGPEHVFSYINPDYYRLVGQRELLGKSVREALPELAGQGFYELLDTVYQTGEPFVGNELPAELDRQGNGEVEVGFFNFVYQPMRSGNGAIEGIMVHAVEISDQVRARHAVQASEDRFRTLVRATSQIVWTNDAEGRAIDMPEWRAYTGQSLEAHRGFGWAEALHPDDREPTTQAWLDAVASRGLFEVDYRIRRADGVYRWFAARGLPVLEADGSIREWVGTCTDIDDLRRTRVERDRFFEAGLDLMAIATTDGYFKRVNPAFVSTLGYSEAELVSMPFLELVHPDDVQPTLDIVAEMARRGVDAIDFENRYRCKDGSYRWLSWRTSRPVDEGVMFSVARDITEKKLSEERLQALNEELGANAEELQAQTEELQSQAEELQSQQIELQALYDRLRDHNASVEAEVVARTAELQAQHQFSETLIDNQAGAFAYLDRDLVYQRTNTAFARLFNRVPADFLGRPLREIFQGDEAQVAELLENVLATGETWSAVSFPFFYTDERGRQETYWDFTCAALKDADGTPIGLIINAFEVSERVRLQALQAQQAAHTALRADVGEALASEQPLGTILQACTQAIASHLQVAYARIYTYDEEHRELVAQGTGGQLTPPEEFPARVPLGKHLIGQIALEKRARLVDHVADDPDFQARDWARREGLQGYAGFPLLVGDRLVGMVALADRRSFSQNDTADLLATVADALAQGIERKQSREALKASEERFRVIFKQAEVGMAIGDRAGRTLDANPAYERLTARAADWHRTQDFRSLTHPLDVATEERLFEELLAGQRQSFQIEKRLCLPSGEVLWVDLAVTRAHGMPDPEAFYLASMHDVSARIEAAKAREANRLKSEFLANMSHELRTPLNSIIGYSELVKASRKAQLDDRSRENLEVVLRNAHHLLSLINDILDLSKVEAGKLSIFPEPLSPERLLRAVAATTEPMAREKGLALEVAIDPALGEVVADETKLRQIVLNLVSNAIKFTRTGNVRITAGPAMGDRWHLSVVDTGIGIAPEHQALVFEEFRQVDASSTREAGGTGLGLAIAQRLARLMGGELRLESTLGSGSTFTLELPRQVGSGLTAAPDAAAQGQLREVQRQEPGRYSVLAIDDDPETLHLIREKLRDTPYTVITASSGEEGLELARTIRPYAVTLDIMMPHMDGWTVLRELKRDPATADLPVVVVSFVDNRLMGFSLGASAYLNKPIETDHLRETLERFGDRLRGTGGYVLVVDDDADTRGLYRQVLDCEGVRIVEAADGREAIAAMERERPTLVLLDLMMPQVDGFEVTAWIRTRFAGEDVPVIVITAKELAPGDVGRLGNVRRIVPKPAFDENLLLEDLRAVLDRHRSAREGQAPEASQ